MAKQIKFSVAAQFFGPPLHRGLEWWKEELNQSKIEKKEMIAWSPQLADNLREDNKKNLKYCNYN